MRQPPLKPFAPIPVDTPTVAGTAPTTLGATPTTTGTTPTIPGLPGWMRRRDGQWSGLLCPVCWGKAVQKSIPKGQAALCTICSIRLERAMAQSVGNLSAPQGPGFSLLPGLGTLASPCHARSCPREVSQTESQWVPVLRWWIPTAHARTPVLAPTTPCALQHPSTPVPCTREQGGGQRAKAKARQRECRVGRRRDGVNPGDSDRQSAL